MFGATLTPVTACLLALALPSSSLDNGLARTPPSTYPELERQKINAGREKRKYLDGGCVFTLAVGWMDWERFRCIIDCEKDPQNCIR